MVSSIRVGECTLFPLASEHLSAWLEMYASGAEHFALWLPAVSNEETPKSRFERVLLKSQNDDEVRMAAMLEDGRMAGVFALNQIHRFAFQNAIAGWMVAADCTGRGIGTACVTALLDLAFAPEPIGLGLHRVQAAVIPENAASVRVAEKAGFRQEGLAKDYLKIAGRWQDHILFAKLSDEHELTYIEPTAAR